MTRRKVLAGIAILVLTILAPQLAAQGIANGRWTGSVYFDQGAEPISIRLIDGGGLLDLPAQQLFGFPLARVVREGSSISFSLVGTEGTGPSLDTGGDAVLSFEGTLAAPGTGPRIDGFAHRGSENAGKFYLLPALPEDGGGTPFSVQGGAGRLSGTLLVPQGTAPFPLALLLSGAGASDRDGNNPSVPGRSDSLKLLASALASRGIASLRYDKRGSGESYRLVKSESELRFDGYVEDAAAAIRVLASDRRFSRVIVVGHTEGALVGAAASLSSGNASRVAGLVLLCASGTSALETVRAAMAGAPPGLAPEADSILKALAAGKTWPNPSPYFAAFFRPSFQPYLASWFKYDLKEILPRLGMPILLVQGNNDVQVTLADFAKLADASPLAAPFILPDMNHALKSTGPDLKRNYASFSDPSFPLAPGLADMIAQIARGERPEGPPAVRYTPDIVTPAPSSGTSSP